MKERTLKYYTYRYLLIAVLIIIAIWAASFYWLIIKEVYDTIDKSLNNSKNRIIANAKIDTDILNTREFGIGNFMITPLPGEDYSENIHIYSTQVNIGKLGNEYPARMLQTIFHINNQYFQLEVYASTLEDDEFLQNLLLSLIVLYFSIVISIIFINYFVLDKALRPFYAILKKLKIYRIDKSNNYLSVQSPIKEFNELDVELYGMTQRNEKIYNYQKDFIGNAAHELQTPLSIISNKIELLMEDENISFSIAEKINEVYLAVYRLKNLNKSLLTLAKISSGQFPEKKLIHFNPLIHSIVENLTELSDFKTAHIQIIENGNFDFSMNEELAHILIFNLIKNAVTHSEKQTVIKILIEKNSIYIQNPGKQKLDEQMIFKRFYKNNQSKSSTGLGLSIVETIIQLYPALSIQYQYQDKHIFALRKRK
ncbi:MAG: HAMP domain-containing histidine kinase [Chitinophagales bacterium]|nr:HAMP domain-containing histidine kinase [Chitinophagales bacterium]